MSGFSRFNIVSGAFIAVSAIFSLIFWSLDTYDLTSDLVSLALGLWLLLLGYLLKYKKKSAYYLTIGTYTFFMLYYLFFTIYSIITEGFQGFIIYEAAIIVFLVFSILHIKDNKSDFI